MWRHVCFAGKLAAEMYFKNEMPVAYRHQQIGCCFSLAKKKVVTNIKIVKRYLNMCTTLQKQSSKRKIELSTDILTFRCLSKKNE